MSTLDVTAPTDASASPDPAGFVAIAHRVVWCTLATVDARGRPRSRLVHPVWELTPDGPVGRVSTRATPTKLAHLAHSPFASCSYWDPQHDVAVAECAADWDPDPAASWSVFSVPPPPVGFDPAAMFAGGTDDPQAAIIVLRPWRLRWARAADLAAGRAPTVWRQPSEARERTADTSSGGHRRPDAVTDAGTAIPPRRRRTPNGPTQEDSPMTADPVAADTVSRDMFTVLHGQPAPVVTRWTYTAADPFAVTLGVRARSDRFVEWLVARDLVIDSLHGPTGCGDIRMSPQHVQGYDIVEIEIRSTDGRAVLEVDRDLLAAFLDASTALVPVGAESGHMDLDAEINKITSRA